MSVVANGQRLNADRIAAAIYEGAIETEEEFTNVILALQHVLKQAGAHVTWRFTFEGREIASRTVPLKVWRHWQNITGQSYTVCHPDNAEHARALIAAVLLSEGVEYAEAFERADNMPGWEVARSKVEEVADGAPFGSGSTGSSTTSPDNPGTGRRRSRSTNKPVTLPDT